MSSRTDISRIPYDWPNKAWSQSIKLAGINWHYQLSQHANANARVLVFIHGTGASAHSWAPIFHHLRQTYTVLAVDLPGHGFSVGAVKSQLRIEEISKHLKILFETIGYPEPHVLIGHSAGTNCALHLSLLLKKTPAAIIGFNPSLVNPLNSLLMFLSPLVHPLLTSNLTASILAASIPKTNLINALLDSTNSILSEVQRAPYRTLFKEQNHIYGSMNFMAATNIPELLAKSVHLETQFTFLVGKDDQWVPQSSLLPVLETHFPKATIHLEDGGHLFHEVNPQRSIEMIQQAIDQL